MHASRSETPPSFSLTFFLSLLLHVEQYPSFSPFSFLSSNTKWLLSFSFWTGFVTIEGMRLIKRKKGRASCMYLCMCFNLLCICIKSNRLIWHNNRKHSRGCTRAVDFVVVKVSKSSLSFCCNSSQFLLIKIRL